MKVKFLQGEGQVTVQFNREELPEWFKAKNPEAKPDVRSTSLTVTLPNNQKLTSKVGCHTGDSFCRRFGRRYAFLKLIDADTSQAVDKALAQFDDSMLKVGETEESLAQAAKKFYQLCREDRRAISRLVCPEYWKNTPERKLQRERSIYERLKLKFDKVKTPENVKALHVNQKADGPMGLQHAAK